MAQPFVLRIIYAKVFIIQLYRYLAILVKIITAKEVTTRIGKLLVNLVLQFFNK